MMPPTSTRHAIRRTGLMALVCVPLWAGCAHAPVTTMPVVPTTTTLPQTAKVHLTEMGAYAVEPGATMQADPNLQNRVTSELDTLTGDAGLWERFIAEYVSGRRTFERVVTEEQADVDLRLRVTIYVDPSVELDFEPVYVARAEATLLEDGSGRLLGDYRGFGKAPGSVPSTESREPHALVNRALQGALSDLFGKLESDGRLAVRRGTARLR